MAAYLINRSSPQVLNNMMPFESLVWKENLGLGIYKELDMQLMSISKGRNWV